MIVPTPPVPYQHLKIFVGSPGDVAVERKYALNTLEVLRAKYPLDIYRWEDTIPGYGEPPEEQIYRQIPASDCHVVVIILWSRLGTPTGMKRDEHTQFLSGTQYEIEKAIEAYEHNQNGTPRIMIYRKLDDPCPQIKSVPDEIIQYGRLLEFLKLFEPGGKYPAWIYPFRGDEFETVFPKHIDTVLSGLLNGNVSPLIPEADYSKDWATRVGLLRVGPDLFEDCQDGYISNEDLRHRIQFWLISISEDRRAPYRSVGQLCDIADGLTHRIDDEIVELAQGRPSSACWLIERLFQVHCSIPDPPRLIRTSTWQRVRFEWETTARHSITPPAQADFRIDAKKIYFGEQALVLSVLSQSLLRRMLEVRGDLCTFDELIAVGWPYDNSTGVNIKALQEAIRRLRRDLSDRHRIDAKWWIETIYGQGYRLRLADETRNQCATGQKGNGHVH